MAGAVGDVANEFAQTKMDLLKNQTRISVMETERDYGEVMQNEKLNLDVNNPSAWPEQMAQASKRYLNDLGSKELSPAAKESLQLRLGDYEGKLMRQIGSEARIAQVERLAGEYENRQMSYEQNSDFDGMRHNLDSSADDLRMTDQERDRAHLEINAKERQMNEDYAILTGDTDYFSKDNWTGAESDRVRGFQKAEAAGSRAEASEVSAIQRATSLGSITSKEDLARNIEEAENIKPATAKAMLKNWDNTKPVDGEERQKYLDWMNDTVNKYRDGTFTLSQYEKEYYEIETATKSLGRRDTNSEIGDRFNEMDIDSLRQHGILKPKDDKQRLLKMIEEEGLSSYKAGAYYPIGSDPDELDKIQIGTARHYRTEVQEEMKRWLLDDSNPDAVKARSDRDAFLSKWSSIESQYISGGDIDRQSDEDLYNSIQELDQRKTLLPPIDQ